MGVSALVFSFRRRLLRLDQIPLESLPVQGPEAHSVWATGKLVTGLSGFCRARQVHSCFLRGQSKDFPTFKWQHLSPNHEEPPTMSEDAKVEAGWMPGSTEVWQTAGEGHSNSMHPKVGRAQSCSNLHILFSLQMGSLCTLPPAPPSPALG